MQAEAYHVFGSVDSTTPLDQAGNRFTSFQRCILSIDCGLYKQISSGVQAIFHNLTTCCKQVQADIFWIWLARNFNFCQWTLLYCRWFQQCNKCIPCQSYHMLTSLPTIQWTCWKVCTDYEKPILQGKRRGERSIEVFNDIPPYNS